jgi:retron-type reverse transcriptase
MEKTNKGGRGRGYRADFKDVVDNKMSSFLQNTSTEMDLAGIFFAN